MKVNNNIYEIDNSKTVNENIRDNKNWHKYICNCLKSSRISYNGMSYKNAISISGKQLQFAIFQMESELRELESLVDTLEKLEARSKLRIF